MEILYKKEYLVDCWANDKKIKIKNKNYRVGKMSYGDFFFETGPEKSETEPFNRGTKWLKKIDGHDIYQISYTI